MSKLADRGWALLVMLLVSACPDQTSQQPCNRDRDCAQSWSCVDGICKAVAPGTDASYTDAVARDLEADDLSEYVDALQQDYVSVDSNEQDREAFDHGVEDATSSDIIEDAEATDIHVADTLIADTLIADTLIADTLIADTLIADTLIADVRAQDRTPVPPTLLVNDITVGIDRNETIDADFIVATDADTPPVELVYTLLQAPQRGTLYLDGTALSTDQNFTHLDVSNGLLRYVHNGTLVSTDSLEISLSDGLHSVGPRTLVVNVLVADAFGTGRDGDLLLTSGSRVVNSCVAINAARSGNRVVVDLGDSFSEGGLVLLQQVQDGFAESGDQEVLSENHLPSAAGIWQIARVNSISRNSQNDTLTLSENYDHVYVSNANNGQYAQICTVPEYRDVTVSGTGSLQAAPWNGSSGGILAFYVSGALTLTSNLSATGNGFRGGVTTLSADVANVVALDTDTQPGTGGAKGEGLDGVAFRRFGRGNYANGAGAGNARCSGGGGGGNGGRGGSGGYQFEDAEGSVVTWGMGGAALEFPYRRRLSFGGGGGSGQSVDETAGAGGNGGGAVIVNAASIAGTGDIFANGLLGSNSVSEGAGGAGAGGTIWIRTLSGDGYIGALRANGANGGDVSGTAQTCGPGGGGGGGTIDAVGFSSSANLHGWQGGAGSNILGVSWGASNGVAGLMIARPAQ